MDKTIQMELTEKTVYISELIKFPAEKMEIFSGAQEHYRNRMDFAFHESGLGQKEKGKWYKVIDVEKSTLANNKVNELLVDVRESVCSHQDFDAYKIAEHIGTFKHAVIRATNLTSSITFILNRESNKLKLGQELIRNIKDKISSDNILIGYATKESGISISDDIEVIKGSEYLKGEFNRKVFKFHSQGFFQVNEEVAQKIVQYVRVAVSGDNNDILVDLYGGVGLFGVSCADLFNEVYIVESFEGSLLLAKENARLNNVTNVEAFNLDVKRIDLLKLNQLRNIKVIVDPPRSGMTSKAIKKILKMRAEKIIYVSCNPKKFAEEIERFTRKGYIIQRCALFDMFPGTKHIEMVSVLVKVEE